MRATHPTYAYADRYGRLIMGVVAPEFLYAARAAMWCVLLCASGSRRRCCGARACRVGEGVLRVRVWRPLLICISVCTHPWEHAHTNARA